ncbi:MAG: methanogenesis marker 14 protein [Candidatus Thorarchaeota archaeon]|jgi:putative methanogenesis marker protein 14
MVKRVKVLTPRSVGVNTTRVGPFYTVASVELGNTTTKCILLTTNLKSADLFEIAKEVRFTRDVRPPAPGEEIFGETLVGVKLTRESVTELIADTLTSVIDSVGMDIEKDLHFVVRSTGVTAGFADPEDVGEMVKALADGCLRAGVPPRKMTASLSPENLPPSLREFTWLKKVYFDGAVASSLPPANASVVANEMEGELVTAGLKGAAKNTTTDFRNPVMTLDFGTTLAGRVTDDSFPYAKTIGSFAGLAGAIPDALVRGSLVVDREDATALDLDRHKPKSGSEINQDQVHEIHNLIRVEKIGKGTNRFGTVPVNPTAAEESGVILIGVDVGTNGSKLKSLEKIGDAIFTDSELDGLLMAIDLVQSHLVKRLVSLAEENSLILNNTSLGLTGRAITTGQKPDLIASNLTRNDESLWVDNHDLFIAEDGLAMGAAVAARCMNSMGTRECPMGGRKGDKCVMGARIKLQRKNDSP